MPNDFLEKTLEDIIFENPDKAVERGFPKLYRHLERQFKLPSGKVIDLLSWEIKENIFYAKVIELKKDECGGAAFWQVIAYMDELFSGTMFSFSDVVINPVLCGKEIDEIMTSVALLDGTLEFVSYSYDWDGIRFEGSWARLIQQQREAREKGEMPTYSAQLSKDFIAKSILHEEVNKL